MLCVGGRAWAVAGEIALLMEGVLLAPAGVRANVSRQPNGSLVLVTDRHVSEITTEGQVHGVEGRQRAVIWRRRFVGVKLAESGKAQENGNKACGQTQESHAIIVRPIPCFCQE